MSDDAPLTTAKQDDAAARAADGLAEAKGDDLSGKTVTIDRPREELYAFWREVRNLPLFLENVVAVEPLDDRRSRWVGKAPAGSTGEGVSAFTADRPGETIAGASEEGAGVPNSARGAFSDAPGGRGRAGDGRGGQER